MCDAAAVTDQTDIRFPLGEHLGLHLDEVDGGVAVARLHAGAAHLNPHGTVHGAVLFAMVDTAMGAATMSLLDDEHWCASIEVQLRFTRACFGGPLEARVEVLHAGKRVVHLDGRVRDGEGRLLAAANGSFAVLRRPQP